MYFSSFTWAFLKQVLLLLQTPFIELGVREGREIYSPGTGDYNRVRRGGIIITNIRNLGNNVRGCLIKHQLHIAVHEGRKRGLTEQYEILDIGAGSSYTYSHFICIIILWGQYYHLPFSQPSQSEASEKWIACPTKGKSRSLSPGLIDSKALAFSFLASYFLKKYEESRTEENPKWCNERNGIRSESECIFSPT